MRPVERFVVPTSRSRRASFDAAATRSMVASSKSCSRNARRGRKSASEVPNAAASGAFGHMIWPAVVVV
jgi:hypothetical protein